MPALSFAISKGLACCSHGNEVITTRSSRLAELDFVGISPEVGVQGKRDEVLVDVFWFDLGPGVLPGAVSRAGSSCPAQRTAIGSGEDHQRLVFHNRLSACLGDIGQPIDVAPRAFAYLRFDDKVKAVNLSL